MVDFTKSPLVPAIAQDVRTGQVLMMAYMSQESLRRTLESGQAWFWSRSRQELWHKGATSGNFLNIKKVAVDCDGDTLLLLVEATGPACHTGATSCFFTEVAADAEDTTDQEAEVMAALRGTPIGAPSPEAEEAHPLDALFAIIDDRKATRPEGSYTAALLTQGIDRPAKKVVEEAGEAAIAAVSQTDERLIEEMADLWYHSLILLAARGLTPAQVYQELRTRRR